MLSSQPSNRLSERSVGVLLILVSAIAYAWLPIIAKWGYAAGLRPTELLTLRFAIAGPLMWLLTVRETTDSRTVPRIALLALGMLFAVVAMTAFFALWRGIPMLLDVMHGAPKSAPMTASFGEKWRPYRSVATWYLWRSLDPIPVEY